MCFYRYVYYSRCQHGEFVKYSYCDVAKALGQHQRDVRLLSDPTADVESLTTVMETLPLPEPAGAPSQLEALYGARMPQDYPVPRSVHHEGSLDTSSYPHLNIDIPLDTQSSLAMQLTHGTSDSDRARASSSATIRPSHAALTTDDSAPRKSNPTHGKTVARAPVLMTQRREEEREKRRSVGQSDSPNSPHTAHASASGSLRAPLRKSQSTLTITVSPTKTAMATKDSGTQPIKVHPLGEAPLHSARHSPVSEERAPERVQSSACSPTSFVTALELQERVSYFTLSDADGAEQRPNGTVFSLTARKSAELRARSSTASKQAAMTRATAPKLSLRIPRPSTISTDRKITSVTGSATRSGSGSPASLPRSSQIPRATVDTSLRPGSASRGKSPLEGKGKAPMPTSKEIIQDESGSIAGAHDVPPETPTTTRAVRHVQTLNSTGATPIITRESLEKSPATDKHAMVTSYLETVEHSVPDEASTPLPAEEMASSSSQNSDPTAFSRSIADRLSRSIPSETSSRVTSGSTVKAGPVVDPVLQDAAIVSYRKDSDASGTQSEAPASRPDTENQPTEPQPQAPASPIRGRSSEYIPQSRRQNRSDLSATAAEFVPRQQENPAPAPAQPPAQPPAQDTMARYGLPFDPYALDMYGIPWYYHMYPVSIQGPMSRSPRKRRTFPPNRTRGNSSPTKPSQSEASSSTASKPETIGQPEIDAVPFSAQLEEIARHAAVRHGKAQQQAPVLPPSPNTPMRPRRMRTLGNGLYSTVGRRGRLAGVPIEATTPFPAPVPPTGRRDVVSYEVVKREATCNIYNIDRAAEWGGGVCNKCAPDH